MRALGDPRRKAPVEPKKTETVAPKVEEPAPAPSNPLETFDESVVIN